MTATHDSLLAQCNALNGYQERGDNITKIWTELDPALQGGSWCAAGVSYLWKHAGGGFPAIDRPYGFVNCQDAHVYARQHGLWDTSGHYEFGDTALFSWNGSDVAEHTGIVISDQPGVLLHTFECNTGSTYFGSQSNGDVATFKTRPHNRTLLGVVKTSRFLASGGSHPAPAPTGKTNPFMASAAPCRRGDTGNDVRFVQWAASVPVDGIFGQQTFVAVVQFQHYAFPGQPSAWDGIVGPLTIAAMKRKTH